MKILPLIPNAINLFEALDTKFTNQTEWEFDGDEYTCSGMINNDTYRVYLQYITIDDTNTPLDNTTFLNLGFAKKISNEEETEKLQKSNENRSKVIGAVSNTLKDKVSELANQFKIDFIVLFVIKEEEKRLRLYNLLVSSPMYGLRPWRKIGTVTTDEGFYVVCTKNKGQPPNIDEFIAWLKFNNKNFSN